MEKTGSQVQNLILTLLRFYQRWISAMFPPCCRYIPTCSSYTLEAVEKFGAGRGLWMGFTRLMRCHPWREGGYDPVPEEGADGWRRAAASYDHRSCGGCNSHSQMTAHIRGKD